MSKRCSGFAVSTSRICRKKFTFLIQNKRYCYIHARFEFNKYARRIQKHWIGYRSRCLMKNIYNKLPEKKKKKIIFYVRENYLIKKYQHDVICRILDRKLDRVWLLSVINNFRNRDIKNLNSNYTKLDSLFRLTLRVYLYLYSLYLRSLSLFSKYNVFCPLPPLFCFLNTTSKLTLSTMGSFWIHISKCSARD